MSGKTQFTSAEIANIFEVPHRHNLLSAEKHGSIPKAGRKRRSANYHGTRVWEISQLPEIGTKYGQFNEIPSKMKVITVYVSKGGTGKTTVAANIARILAINSARVLVVGLDMQGSITDMILNPLVNVETLDDLVPLPGLYETIYGTTPLDKVITKTSIPTLDIVAENISLIELAGRLAAREFREETLKEKVQSLEKEWYPEVIRQIAKG